MKRASAVNGKKRKYVIVSRCCKKKKNCKNVLNPKEIQLLSDILKQNAEIIPPVVLDQDEENIRRLRFQMRRLNRLVRRSKICKKTRLIVILELSLTILRPGLTPPMNLVVHLEQMVIELSNIVNILENPQQEINQINVLIQNIENIINNVLGTPGAPGAPGEQGIPGPQGPMGVPGTFSPVYANIFDTNDQWLEPNQPVRFNQFDQPGSILFGGITATQTSLTVPVAGDYAILWEVVFLPVPTQTHCAFGVFVNGILQNSTRSGTAAFQDQEFDNTGSVAILRLNAGDVIELRALIPPGSSQTAIQLSSLIQYPPFGGTADQPINSASLRTFKLGPS